MINSLLHVHLGRLSNDQLYSRLKRAQYRKNLRWVSIYTTECVERLIASVPNG